MNKGIAKRAVATVLSVALASAYVPVSVNAASTKKLTVKNYTVKKSMAVGSVYALKTNIKSSELSYSSNDESVAVVDENGQITAKKKGKAKITISYGKTKKKVTVKVTKKPIGFTISKTSGTYEKAFSVKVKAKKNYKVYYKTGRKFNSKKVIKAGKAKSFVIKNTKSLSFYAVKKSKKVTTKKLNKLAKKAKNVYTYKYVIGKDIVKGAKVEQKDDQNNINNKNDKKDDKNEYVSTPDKQEEKNDKDVLNDSLYNDSDLVVPEVVKEDNTEADEAAKIIDETTPVVTFAEDGVSTTIGGVEGTTDSLKVANIKGITRILINADGTYAFSGKIENAIIVVLDDVNADFIFKDFTIDDTKLAESVKADNAVISLGKGTNVTFTLIGENTITGSESYAKASGIIPVINQKGETGEDSSITILNGGNGSLNVIDGMDKDTDFAGKDPADGIATKGILTIASGDVNVVANGDCLKAAGAKGLGGVRVTGGNIALTSYHGAAIKSKNGTIDITGGVVDVLYAADDALNAKNYSVNISGGYLNADNIYGDGIQANFVNISDGDVVIKTYFENPGLNYFNEDLGEGNYNTLEKIDNLVDSVKIEKVNVDLGSHKGIKAGTKEYYYTYKNDKEGVSSPDAEFYTQADGGVNISGGSIFLDTTNTGLKYTGAFHGKPIDDVEFGVSKPDMEQGGFPTPPSLNRKNGNLTTVGEGQVILGSPEDGIKSQNSFAMTGGKLVINASDDGVSVANDATITGDSKIYVNKAYEGFEAKDIVFGTKDGVDAPYLYVYSNDDGINVTEKYRVECVYEDKSEEKYETTTYSRSGGGFTVNSGEMNIYIADDKKHDYKLHVSNGYGVVEDDSYFEGTYEASGDGIDCNGSLYANGGKILVYGSSAPLGDLPIDCSDEYYIGEGAVILATGDMGMRETPTEVKQPIISFGGSSAGEILPPPEFDPSQGEKSELPEFPEEGFKPAPINFDAPSPIGIEAGTFYKIVDAEGNVVLTGIAKKRINYLLYSTSDLKLGTTYKLIAGDTVTETTATKDVSTQYVSKPDDLF